MNCLFRWICNLLAACTKPRFYRWTRLQLSQELILRRSTQAFVGMRLGIWLDCPAEGVYITELFSIVFISMSLWVPERIQFRLAILAFCCRNHKAPSYLADDLHWTDEAESRHRLRSGSCPRLIVSRTLLSTIDDRSFRVTVTQAWNSLPTNVTASTSLPSFKRQLKLFLFTKSFPSL